MTYIDLDINCASVLQPDGTCHNVLFVYMCTLCYTKSTLEYFARFVMLAKLAEWNTGHSAAYLKSLLTKI